MTVYALKHPDGRWLYHLPAPSAGGSWPREGAGVFADGQPMEKLHHDWWATPGEATRLTATSQPLAKTTGYRLSDPAVESVRYPATLTLEEWEERRYGPGGETLWELYDHITEEQPPLEHVYDGPIMVLEGREPPGPGEPQWVAQLPYALANRPEYLHLFPGHIPGLVEHLMGVFKAMPRIEYVFLNFQNKPGVYVSLRVPYDEPRTEFRPDTGRKGQKLKSGRTVQVLVSRSLTLPIPSRVTADTYEQALSLWEQQVTYWTGVVAEASVAACSHCDGKGYVPTGAGKYPTPR